MGPYEAAKHVPGVSGHELSYVANRHFSIALFTHFVPCGAGEAVCIVEGHHREAAQERLRGRARHRACGHPGPVAACLYPGTPPGLRPRAQDRELGTEPDAYDPKLDVDSTLLREGDLNVVRLDQAA